MQRGVSVLKWGHGDCLAMKWGKLLDGWYDLNLFHQREVSRINVVFVHQTQAISVNLLPSNPAPSIDPVGWMTKKQIYFHYFAHLLVGHVLIKFPFAKQGHDLVDIEGGELGFVSCGRVLRCHFY